MKPERIDYSLYLVTDRGLAKGRALLDIVRAAVQGGVTCVQLREKTCSTREFIEEALAVNLGDQLPAQQVSILQNANRMPEVIADTRDRQRRTLVALVLQLLDQIELTRDLRARTVEASQSSGR